MERSQNVAKEKMAGIETIAWTIPQTKRKGYRRGFVEIVEVRGNEETNRRIYAGRPRPGIAS